MQSNEFNQHDRNQIEKCIKLNKKLVLMYHVRASPWSF